MENEISDRTLEIFYRLLRGESVSNKAVAEKYGISSRTVSRDIGRIQDFLAENRELMQNSEVIYSHKEKAYILKSDEFLKNQELFALAKIVLGSRSLNKEELLTILSKLKKFTTTEDRQSLESIIRRATARKNQENLLKIMLDKNSSSKEHLKRLALRLNLTEVKDL